MRRPTPPFPRHLLPAAAAALVLAVAPRDARADTAGAAKPIGVVDVQRVIDSSRAGKAAKQKLEQDVKREEGSLKSLQDEVRSLGTDFEKQRAVLSGAALDQKAENLDKKRRELDLKFRETRAALAKKNRGEIGKLVGEIDREVKALAKERGLAFVLEQDPRLVLYAGPALDVTGDVIRRLDG